MRAAMFVPAPAGTPVAEVVRRASPARRLRDAFEPIAMHQVWSASVNERIAALGLDFFAGYAWGRAAVLGDVTPAVAASAFAVFEPDLIAGRVEAGRAVVERGAMLEALDETTIASLRAVIGDEDADQVAAVADVLCAAVQEVDGTGRPLFSGVRSLGWPEDPIGRVWRACHALREHRGDGHVAAFVAAGIDPVRMNILTELWLHYPLGAYSRSRAWGPTATDAALAALRADGSLDGDALTSAGRAMRDQIEEATDRTQAGVVAVVGDHLDEVTAALDRWSRRCIEAGAFPPDARKRAAG